MENKAVKTGDSLQDYTLDIITKIAERNGTPFLDLISSPESTFKWYKGETRIIKSKWRIVNFFRKLFNCEKKYTEWYTKWEYNGNSSKED